MESQVTADGGDEEREVERVVAQVRFGAFRALRLVGTTLGIANLALAAVMHLVTGTVTPGLRLQGIAQLVLIASGWLFNERTHRVGAMRVDKRFVFERWMLALYVDVQNATNRANVEGTIAIARGVTRWVSSCRRTSRCAIGRTTPTTSAT